MLLYYASSTVHQQPSKDICSGYSAGWTGNECHTVAILGYYDQRRRDAWMLSQINIWSGQQDANCMPLLITTLPLVQTHTIQAAENSFLLAFFSTAMLEASRNGTFLQAVTKNRLWKCISTGGSVMPTACRNLFPENRKSVFKNRKKKILIQGRPIGYSPARLRRSRKSRFFRVKSRASRPVGFDGCTDPVELVSIAPNSILYTVPNSIGVKVTNELSWHWFLCMQFRTCIGTRWLSKYYEWKQLVG
jgi:hypothetical protein